MNKKTLYTGINKLGSIASLALTALPALEYGSHVNTYKKMFNVKPTQGTKGNSMTFKRFSGVGNRTFF